MARERLNSAPSDITEPRQGEYSIPAKKLEGRTVVVDEMPAFEKRRKKEDQARSFEQAQAGTIETLPGDEEVPEVQETQGPTEINPEDLEPIAEVEVTEEPTEVPVARAMKEIKRRGPKPLVTDMGGLEDIVLNRGKKELGISPAAERERVETLRRELDAMIEVVDEGDSRTAIFLNGLRGGLATLGLRAARIVGQGRDAVTGALRGTAESLQMGGAMYAESAKDKARRAKDAVKGAGTAVAGTASGLADHAREEVVAYVRDMGDNITDAGSWTLDMAVASLESVKYGIDNAEELVEQVKQGAKEKAIAGVVGTKNAYDRGAQKIGEGVLTGAEVAAKTALELGLVIPRAAVGGVRAGMFVGTESLAVAKGALGLGVEGAKATARGAVEAVKVADRLGTKAVKGSVEAVKTADRLGSTAVRETVKNTKKASSWGLAASIRGLLGLSEAAKMLKAKGDYFDANAVEMALEVVDNAVNKGNELAARGAQASNRLVGRISSAWSKVWETRFGLASKSIAEKKKIAAENAALNERLTAALGQWTALEKANQARIVLESKGGTPDEITIAIQDLLAATSK